MPKVPVSPELNKLAETLIGESDITDLYEALMPFLSLRDFILLGGLIELCPIHLCDIQICIDDRQHGVEVYD